MLGERDNVRVGVTMVWIVLAFIKNCIWFSWLNGLRPSKIVREDSLFSGIEKVFKDYTFSWKTILLNFELPPFFWEVKLELFSMISDVLKKIWLRREELSVYYSTVLRRFPIILIVPCIGIFSNIFWGEMFSLFLFYFTNSSFCNAPILFGQKSFDGAILLLGWERENIILVLQSLQQTALGLANLISNLPLSGRFYLAW